jgi:hypothetical protein
VADRWCRAALPPVLLLLSMLLLEEKAAADDKDPDSRRYQAFLLPLVLVLAAVDGGPTDSCADEAVSPPVDTEPADEHAAAERPCCGWWSWRRRA